jgi:hypothetical protein
VTPHASARTAPRDQGTFGDGPFDIAGVMSHLACADEPGHPSVAAQVAAFARALDVLEQLGVRPRLRHLANSAGALVEPRARYDMVRTGLLLYGCAPAPELAAGLDLRPVMQLRSRIAQLKTIPPGDHVGYGWTFTARRETSIAVLPVGYAYGYRFWEVPGLKLTPGGDLPPRDNVPVKHWIRRHDGIPIRVADVADVAIGHEVRRHGRQEPEVLGSEGAAPAVSHGERSHSYALRPERSHRRRAHPPPAP